MNPERYKRVDQVFQQALSQPPASVESFLRQACGDDQELRREVESLIEHERQAGSLIAFPVSPSVVDRQTESGEEDFAGRTLLHYRIVEKIGQGGMGVVYRAEDNHLKRPVAIKVLPPGKMADSERKRRFIHEARAASALDHPNIVTIHDITSADGIDFIAMEYVAGAQLAELIDGKGLPIRETLHYAIQIADALASAHRAGIIHRDLKPSNVIVTEDGTVKILDFGLAKLMPGAHDHALYTESVSDLPTESRVIVGTVAYMSPEQAEGKAVDQRSDIFAFGGVLYEMVTGRRAFKGESDISTLAAVLHEEPEPIDRIAGRTVPAELERIISRCLRKEPDRRFQHIDDVKVALQELTEEMVKRRWSNKTYWMTALTAGVAAVGVWTYLRFLPDQEAVPPPKIITVTLPAGYKYPPSLSPDGNWVAFESDLAEPGNWDIYVKDLASPGEPTRLTTDPVVDSNPCWSPDGRQIAFRRRWRTGRGLYVISALGGGERKLADVGDYLAWSPDGKSIVFAAHTGPRTIWSINLDTLEKKQLIKPVSDVSADSYPRYSPDGRYLGFIRRFGEARRAIYRMRLPDEEPRLVTEYGHPSSFCWTADSREIVFSSSKEAGEMALWRIAALGGEPRRVPIRGEKARGPWISGNRLAYLNETGNTDIWRMRLKESEELRPPAEPLLRWPANELGPAVSPDGRRLAFQSDRSGSLEIWVCDIDGSNPKQVTEMKAPNMGGPSWSPDGGMIVFDSRQSGNLDVWAVSADGGPARRLTDHPAEDGAALWSQNGPWIYFYSTRGGGPNLWSIPANGGKARRVTQQANASAVFCESEDGRFLYYSVPGTNPRQMPAIYRVPVSGGPSSLVFEADMWPLQFALTKKGVYYACRQLNPAAYILNFHDFALKQTRTLGRLHDNSGFVADGPIRISRDGQWLFYGGGIFGSEIMLMENFR